MTEKTTSIKNHAVGITADGQPYINIEGHPHIITSDESAALATIVKRQNALAPTKEEQAYLKSHADANLMGSLVWTKQGKPRWDDSSAGLLAMILLAIHSIYAKHDLKLFLTPSLKAYAVPIKKLSDPLTFTEKQLMKYEDKAIWRRIVLAIDGRYHISAHTINPNVVRTMALEWLLDFYRFDPVNCAVKAAIAQHRAGNKDWEPASRQDFVDALSQDVDTEEYEPYREKVLGHYVLDGIVSMRLWKDGISEPAATKTGLQAIPILYGGQGIGKSTLIKILSLGWSDSIRHLERLDQTNILKRNGSTMLEYAELSGMKKASTEDLKESITTRDMTFVPKYSNSTLTLQSQALIVGTTNEAGTLKDLTGNRRFWPLKIKHYDWTEVTESFVIRCLETAYLENKERINNDDIDNLIKISESKEDQAFKADYYAEFDPAEVTIIKFLLQVINSHTLPYCGISRNRLYYYFLKKRGLETAFEEWQQREQAGGRLHKHIYNGKLTSYLMTCETKNSTTTLPNGRTEHVLAVSVKELDHKLLK